MHVPPLRQVFRLHMKASEKRKLSGSLQGMLNILYPHLRSTHVVQTGDVVWCTDKFPFATVKEIIAKRKEN